MSDFTPQGDINLRDVYSIEGAVDITAATVTGLLIATDHEEASTAQVVNVCYGTGDPPEASTTTEGTLFIKYE